MGTITISIRDETERKLRKLAGAKFGKRKGYLGEAVTEAVEAWARSERKKSVAKAMELLEKGFNIGGVRYKSREELYERR